MNLRQWLDATNAHKSRLTLDEKARRRAVRVRVFEKAKTTYATIINALHRGRIGADLLTRLENATEGESERILVADEWPESKEQAAQAA